jgi:hypothetical protein
MLKDRFLSFTTAAIIATCGMTAQSHAADPRDLPPAPQRGLAGDWLLDSSAFKAGVFHTDHPHELVLENGLVRRTFRLSPNAATVGLDHQVTGHAVIRAVRPEVEVTIDGTTYPVGGLVGQPNHAFLLPEWLETMQTDPAAFQFTGFEVGETRERFAWKRVRHHAPDATWPPKGVYLQMHYRMPAPQSGPSASPASDAGRERMMETRFDGATALPDGWTARVTTAHQRSSVANEGKAGEIFTPPHTHAFVERPLPPGVRLVETRIDPGTDRSASWGPGIALVWKSGHTIKLNLGSSGFDAENKPAFSCFDGSREWFNLGKGEPSLDATTTMRLRIEGTAVFCEALHEGKWKTYHQASLPPGLGDPALVRLGKLDKSGGATDHASPPGEPGRLRIESFAAYGPLDEASPTTPLPQSPPITLTVHYELYDGVPVFCKWLTLRNGGDTTITVDRFSSEILAVAEEDSPVETRAGVAQPLPQALHVETDFAFGGFNHDHANRHVVHWRPDPQYTSIVNYTRDQPTLLVVSPDRGPAQDIAPGGTFESHRTLQLVHDSTCRTRRGLTLKRMYRTLAPWTTENPLMHHLLDSRPEAVRQAIDHAAEVGFEMIILSFGSGFNIENDDPAFLDTWKGVADHARSKGIDIGSYSLLSSRRIGGGNDIVSPPGEKPTHGSCPALTSGWGQEYFRKLYHFHRRTGFSAFEHDGSYPGDVDVTPRPPLQKGAEDSQWAQWRIIRDFYQWCRSEGIYLNVPDYYFLSGSNKTGMGYREVNWSLPRAHQVIHTRQNIFDGSWEKTPSMGWMFVPLAQYHGGGAAATIEPLDRHRDHYGSMLASNLAMGVQACYRGPRLFDTPATKAVVKQWVDWFKQHRDILESDMVHGRRADGRDLDWMLHVNPKLETKGMLVVFNPLDREVSRTLDLDLYYTGLEGRARVAPMGGAEAEHPLHRGTRLHLPVTVPAGGLFWATIRNASEGAGRGPIEHRDRRRPARHRAMER